MSRQAWFVVALVAIVAACFAFGDSWYRSTDAGNPDMRVQHEGRIYRITPDGRAPEVRDGDDSGNSLAFGIMALLLVGVAVAIGTSVFNAGRRQAGYQEPPSAGTTSQAFGSGGQDSRGSS